ncbi:MAG: phosphate signaling complex protein PhoU [Leptospirillia bacterium]
MSPQQHTVKQFDEELNELKSMVLSLGGLVEKAIADSIRALQSHDTSLAHSTIDNDRAINALEVKCDLLTSRIIALRQPAASDLRFIMTAIKVVTDLERMGDLAVGICEGTLFLDELPVQPRISLAAMSQLVQSQVSASLDALSRGDVALAMRVIEQDVAIDEMYRTAYREMLTHMLESPQQISAYITLGNVIKNLERIGDHATNVCEMVIYMERGHDVRHVDHQALEGLLKGFDEDPSSADRL